METAPPARRFLVDFYSVILPVLEQINELVDSDITELLPAPLFIAPLVQSMAILLTTLAFNEDARPRFINRLFPNLHGQRNRGRDVWEVLERNPHIFWYATGVTPQTLEVMVDQIRYDVAAPRHLPRTPRSNRRRRCLLDVRNRVLLIIIWLRQYLKIHFLAHLFYISKSTVAEEIYHIVPILFVHYKHYITWHNVNRWRKFLGAFLHFPNAVGMIDGTIRRIRRPSTGRQADFYRGDKRCHFMSTQLVVDADGMIVLLATG